MIRPSEWNEMLLKVEGNHYVASLNGVEILDFTDPAPKSFDGCIALQLHSGGARQHALQGHQHSGYVGEGGGQVTLRPARRGFAVREFAARASSWLDARRTS